jgi:hypothetical protein
MDQEVKNNTVNPKEETVHKYSKQGKGQLHESIIMEGKPYFMNYNIGNNRDFFNTIPHIQEETRRLLPPHIEEYSTMLENQIITYKKPRMKQYTHYIKR